MLVVVFYTIGGTIDLTSESSASGKKVGPKKQLLLTPRKSVINVFERLKLGQQKSQFLQSVFAGILQMSLTSFFEEIIVMKYSFDVCGHQPYFTSRSHKARARKVWDIGLASISDSQRQVINECPRKDSDEWNTWVDRTKLIAIDMRNNTYELSMVLQQQVGDKKKKQKDINAVFSVTVGSVSNVFEKAADKKQKAEKQKNKENSTDKENKSDKGKKTDKENKKNDEVLAEIAPGVFIVDDGK